MSQAGFAKLGVGRSGWFVRFTPLLLISLSLIALWGIANPAESHAITYCNQRVAPHTSCPAVGIYDFLQANVNDAYYPGDPGIQVCERVTNWADSITVSRRCRNRVANSMYEFVNWVQCEGGSSSNIHFRAGNDSDGTHTIYGTAYYQNIACA